MLELGLGAQVGWPDPTQKNEKMGKQFLRVLNYLETAMIKKNKNKKFFYYLSLSIGEKSFFFLPEKPEKEYVFFSLSENENEECIFFYSLKINKK